VSPPAPRRVTPAFAGEEIGLINPILTGVSAAAHALEALLAPSKPNPASSSAGAFSTGQSLPGGAAAQTAPSNHSDRFAHAALGLLTALQDPGSAVAGFVSGAETAIGKDIEGVASLLEKLKDALTGAGPGPASVAAAALATGSAAATGLASALDGLLSPLRGLTGGSGAA
jgi:hypothetical protein